MTHLSTRLREGTQHSHTAAENTTFMKCFLQGIVEREPLRKLFADLYFVYSALEAALQRHASHPIVGALYFPELNRVENLSRDLAFDYGENWREQITPSAAGCVYRDRITADGSSGFKAEALRYHLYVSLPCPWAHRTLIMREIKGLNDAISISIVDPIMSDKGWMFSEAPGAILDSVNHAQYLQEIYLKANPNYTGRVTVPVLWDRQTQTIVNNESREIMRMFDVEFAQLATQKIDLYPRDLQQQIDETIDAIYLPINAGVYRAGFAREQIAYEEAVTELFENLDRWEVILSKQRYLCGDRLTEADICMFATLYRFDSVYYSHFKCNLRRILDYPNLWNYLKDLYQRPEFKATCNLDHIKRGYYMSMTDINPNRIVPKGPIIDFDEPCDRIFTHALKNTIVDP